MRFLQIACLAVCLTQGSLALAKDHIIEMKNKGEAGAMVFEPDFLQVQPGDTVTFVAVDKGHNAETLEGMLPEGATPFKGAINEEISVTLTTEGVYGIKCSPHFAMGMVALIVVGAPANLDAAKAVELRGKAKAHFEELFAKITP